MTNRVPWSWLLDNHSDDFMVNNFHGWWGGQYMVILIETIMIEWPNTFWLIYLWWDIFWLASHNSGLMSDWTTEFDDLLIASWPVRNIWWHICLSIWLDIWLLADETITARIVPGRFLIIMNTVITLDGDICWSSTAPSTVIMIHQHHYWNCSSIYNLICDHYQYHLYTYLWFDYGSVHKSWGTPQGGMPLATHSTRSFNNLAAAKRKHRHWTTRPPHVRSVHTWWTSKSDVCSTKCLRARGTNIYGDSHMEGIYWPTNTDGLLIAKHESVFIFIWMVY